MRIIVKWIIAALAVLAASYVIPGITVESLYTALIVALILGILNFTVKPILFLLTLPINILTLGFFSLVINGFLLWLSGTIVKGFSVSGLRAAILGGLVISLITAFGNIVLKKRQWQN